MRTKINVFIFALAIATIKSDDPCQPNPCGAKAVCKEQNGVGSCTCLPGHVGNPYEGCRLECMSHADCSSSRTCIGNRCRDPCTDACGRNAECKVLNHIPTCLCLPNYTGNAFVHCTPIKNDACSPSPCGSNYRCQSVNEKPVCVQNSRSGSCGHNAVGGIFVLFIILRNI